MSEESIPPEQRSTEITCIKIWRILPICKGDVVEIYPRGMRSLVMLRGKVVGISEFALLIDGNGELFSIRLNEIRMIRKLKEVNKQ